MAKTLFNISDKIVAGDTSGDFLAFRNRVLADGGTIETTAETEAEIRRLHDLGLYDDDLTLAYVAGAYKADKWYNIKGASGDLDVVRATNAYRVNRPFALQSVGNNITATSYGTDGTLKGNYIRSALENLFRDSEPATLSAPAGAIISNVTFEANDWGIGLDGKAVFGDNSVNRQWSNTGNLSASTNYSLACIIKPADGLMPTFGSTSSDIARFILSASTLAGTSVIALGNGLFFVTAKGATTGSLLNGNGLLKATGNNNVGFEASAVMTVLGSVDLTLDDYIKTTGSTATRNNDNISKTGISSLIGVNQGWMYAQINLRVFGTNRSIINVSDGTLNNRIQITLGGSGVVETRMVTGGATQFGTPESDIIGGTVRYLVKWSTSGASLFRNGVKTVDITSSITPPTTSIFNVAQGPAGGIPLNDPIYSAFLSKGSISDAKAIQLTTL